jgi:hypothetical protein
VRIASCRYWLRMAQEPTDHKERNSGAGRDGGEGVAQVV